MEQPGPARIINQEAMSETEQPSGLPAIEGIKTKVKETLAQVPVEYQIEVIAQILEGMQSHIRSAKREAQDNLQGVEETEELFNNLVEKLHLKTA